MGVVDGLLPWSDSVASESEAPPCTLVCSVPVVAPPPMLGLGEGAWDRRCLESTGVCSRCSLSEDEGEVGGSLVASESWPLSLFAGILLELSAAVGN